MNWPEAFRRIHRLLLCLIAVVAVSAALSEGDRGGAGWPTCFAIAIAGLACSNRPIDDPISAAAPASRPGEAGGQVERKGLRQV